MREALEAWINSYPVAPKRGDKFGVQEPGYKPVVEGVPHALHEIVGANRTYVIKGSAGQSTWSQVPWVAIMDPEVTRSTQDGFYLVYLLSYGKHRLYLTLLHGCTALHDEIGLVRTERELIDRRNRMLHSVFPQLERLAPIEPDLEAPKQAWRPRLYQAGSVFGVSYDPHFLPPEEDLRADLAEALRIYGLVAGDSAWREEAETVQQAIDEGIPTSIDRVVGYATHRSIERPPSESKRVKKAKGDRCEGCDLRMADVYGAVGDGLIEAHHLTPLSSLKVGEAASWDPINDFAVLCPNCHRIIHRLEDPSDIQALRALLKKP